MAGGPEGWAAALKEAKWELLLPVIALGALFGGLATPVEAAALTAAYAFFVETIIYRDLTIFRDGVRTMSEADLLMLPMPPDSVFKLPDGTYPNQ